ncbi:MAG TPA: pyridoxamine 5'-phosphate oxidase family protein [Firmicutes bacterium]|nr:pyridoxamine 5'-phosphate oxidase family protein [Bacillota bacterium]
MFREMRRKKQALPQDTCAAILREGSAGVLALEGAEGYPYAVPLSYVYAEGKIYFHSAKSGHKIDALRRNPRASFCVVARDQVMPEAYTTCFTSVIAFGTLRILEAEAEKLAAVERLAEKYFPGGSAEHRQAAIRRGWQALLMLEMTIDHLSGKQAKELIGKNPPAEGQ